ncbi:hypothetical protein KP509_28G003000 [Ceratopteris richardii]|nr:hypothetical protein KP509_28G003000 [Ceratopteris richardii]
MSEEKKSSTSQAHKNISFRMQHEERWQFLKQLPDRIIRDIGFVVASPPILLNSHELPTVCPDKLGGGIKNWLKAANWLASLNVDEVKHWFQGKHNNGRLGVCKVFNCRIVVQSHEHIFFEYLKAFIPRYIILIY